MKHTLEAMIMLGDPLMTQAIDAMKRYHQAQEAGLPEAEVERLRLEAEHLFTTIGEYQLAALGYQPLTRQ
ncbi:hypothetical protein SAMN05444507_11135 [Pseudomonas syringae]|uniref:hypothetical protein n=1 Tax=Pseudomonas syringae group TaxID=136849 RepID=UPI0003581931|nr:MULTISPECIES: hypothetical protein [Pseudomonas syringae group]EPM43177.1 hypothetical protein A262_28312 [Pseudomonas syringae pv. actinidiae ICMP 19073]RMO81774.1 hypothetical protein ALQ34_02400 [Pseudomonas syringae pv. maculicola]SFI77419.1 hypothetical protein SAMN05444507_11135 [Pseudomonas syringae]